MKNISGITIDQYFLLKLFICICFGSHLTLVSADDSVLAKPKRGVVTAPPLSQRVPENIKALPLFGSISWKTTQLPWMEEGPYAGISGAAMSVHNGKICVVGGFIPGGDGSNDPESGRTSRWTWVYHPETSQWEQLPNAPFRREYTRSISSDDGLYLIGGGKISKGKKPPYQAYADCAFLDLSHNSPTWKKHSRLNVPRTHTSVGKIGNQLIVVGGNEYEFSERGYSSNTIRNTTEVFDLANPPAGWQIRSPIPNSGRGWSASMTDEKFLYLFGGVTWNQNGSARRIRETMRYDPLQDQWEKLNPPPLAISGWEANLYQNRYALIAGGVMQPIEKNSSGIVWSDMVLAYDLQENVWLKVNGSLPPGAVFNDPGVAIIDDTIYVMGAEGPAGSHYNYFLIGKIKASPH